MQVKEFADLAANIGSIQPHQAEETLKKIRETYQVFEGKDLSMALFNLTCHIMKLKNINPETHQFYEECIKDIIRISVQKEFTVGTEALRNIFDTSQQYYRHSNIDMEMKFPLGYNRPLQNYTPEIGQECDIVKPYISSTNYCGWTRGIILAVDGKKHTVNYANTQNTTETKDVPFCAPLGTRTPDFDWRMNLMLGQEVDSFNKVWYRATVMETAVENGSKRVRVSFRIFKEDGAKTDPIDERKYDGLGPNEDQWVDVLSYRIQKLGKMSKKLCPLSHESEQYITDDTYDLIFEKEFQEKPFYGLMRLNFTRSVSYLTFYEVYREAGGEAVYLKMLKDENTVLDNVFNTMIVLANTVFLIPRMAIDNFLPLALKQTIDFVYRNTKHLNPMRNDMIHFFVDVVGKRIMSLSEKHQVVNDIRKKLLLDFLSMNMQKQMISLRLLYEVINPPLRKITEEEKQTANEFLVKNGLFHQLIQPHIHEQILTRSVELIKYMIQNELIRWTEIEHIWNLFPETDARGRSTVEKMLSQISKAFNINFASMLIGKILQYKESQLTVDNLALLRSLKEHPELTDEDKLKIVKYLWEIITLKAMNITSAIQEELEKVFKSILPKIKSNDKKLQVLELIVQRINNMKSVNNEFDILKDFILTYPKKNENIDQIEEEEKEGSHPPQIISEVITYLKEKDIYNQITRIFSELKSTNVDKMRNILKFTAFMLEHDQQNVNQIARAFYDKMGPSDIFLEWAQNITQCAHEFFLWFFDNVEGIEKFQKLSNSGFEALKAIIFDINIQEGNLKLLKKTKGVSISVETQQKVPGPVQGPVHGPAQKPQTLTFLYLLKSPFECKGMHFLEELLAVVKSSSVYDEIIKLIIEFFVNLDESIEDRTKEFREQFLMGIIQNIEQVNLKNQFDDKIKLKLEISINLLQQLFSATEKEGLFDVKPHFECVAAENFNLKIENQLSGNKLEDIKITISENATLYSFKKMVGEIYNENPTSINVYKFVTPISDDLMAKSLTELHFFNEETIKVMRKSAKDLPRKELTNSTGDDLSPRFSKIVEKWFDGYKSAQRLLGIQELKQLSGECWKGSLLKQINRLNEMIKKFDLTNKNALNLQEFRQFFISKSAQNPSAIWRIINLSGYKNNLKHKDEIQEEISTQIYPRRILSNEKTYKVIFDLLENPTFEKVHLNFYRLLAMLETDKALSSEIKKNSKQLIEQQKSLYRLSYILETVLSELVNNPEFFLQFYQNKGHEFVYHKLISFTEENKSIYEMDPLLGTIIMPNMVKILNTYFSCLYSENKLVRFIYGYRINTADMDALTEKLKKIDEIVGEKNTQEDKMNKIKPIQCQVTMEDYAKLGERIFFNLVTNFNSNLLPKITNQTVRMTATLTLETNSVNKDELLKGLKCQSLNFRRSCQNILFLYVSNNPSQTKPLLDLLLENMPQESKVIYSYYFTLMEKILEMYLDLQKESTDDSKFIELAERLFKKLFNDLPNEKRNPGMEDKLLLGVLVVLNVLLSKRKGVREAFKHYKKELLQKCLFFYHPRERIEKVEVTQEMLKAQKQANHFNDYVKCKSQQTRKVLMEIIFHLHEVSAEEDPLFVDDFILPIFEDLPKKKRKFETKSLQVGLNNLGSTCYLNSMLQILNSVEPFRNALMLSNSEAPLIKQLQALLSYLYFSERQDYVPEELLKAFTPPILKGIQQDTTEFLNILFDQLENCLKGTTENRLLEELFQGTQSAQMICHNCKQKRQRQEEFFTYGVDIEGKYDLNTALEGMYSGELISDCLCEHCGERSDTTKRTVLENIPSVFFVHLRRIVFDYNVFMNTKIHTRLEFPTELNIEPYTKEGIELREKLGVEYMKHLSQNEEQLKLFEEQSMHGKEKDFYKLKLKGIIVHSGGPEVGHYWALNRREVGWTKFDDSKVTVFPHSNMQNECFGGNMVSDEWGGMGSSTNAYVLVYEKVVKSDVVLGSNQNKRIIPYDKFETVNTEQFYKQVWLDNHSLMLENHLLRDTFCREFIHFLISMLNISPSQSKIKVISETLYKVCYQSGEVGKLQECFLKHIDQITPEIFHEFILKQADRTFDLLMHNYSSVRELAAAYIEKVVLHTFRVGSNDDKQKVLTFIEHYLHLLHEDVAKNWLRIDGYFRLFEGLVVNSVDQPELHKWLIDKHLVSYFIDFIMEKSSPLNIYPKKYSIGTKSNPANFNFAISTIFFILKHSYGMTGENYEVPTISPENLHHLSDNDILCLSCVEFYTRMFRERQNLQMLGAIIQRLSIKNLQFSEAIARVMLISINEITDAKDEMKDLCGCLSKFLIITDEHWVNRAEFVLGYSSPYIYNENLIDSIDEERFVYCSTLEDLFPVQCLLAYAHINRLRNPLAVLQIIKTILEGCSVSELSKNYILSQKSPSYCNLRYTDWLKPYLETVIGTLNLSKDKKKELQKHIEQCQELLKCIESSIEKSPEMRSFISGKIGNVNIVDRFNDSSNQCEVVISNVETYGLTGSPTGTGNSALDAFLVHGRNNRKVTQDSNLLTLFKEFNKPLALKNKAIEEAQEKELTDLFDDCVSYGNDNGAKKEEQKKDQETTQKVQAPQTEQQPKPESVEVQPESKASKEQEKALSKEINQEINKAIEEQNAKKDAEINKGTLLEEPAMEEELQTVNVPNLELYPDYFRKIQIFNLSDKPKRVTLRFATNENSNMLVPSKIHFLSSSKVVETMWICKIDHTKGWGVVDYNLTVEEKEMKNFIPRWFKTYGEQQHEQLMNMREPMEVEPVLPENPASNPYQEGTSANPGFDINSIPDEIQCPMCTSFNLSTNLNCEVCGSSMSG